MSNIDLDNQINDLMTKILSALNIEEDVRNQIITDMLSKLNNKSKLELINDNNLQSELIKADAEFANLVKDKILLKNYYNTSDGKAEWNNTMKQLATLQGLIILRKITNNDCNGLVKVLLNAFGNKISAVNNIVLKELNNKSTQYKQSNNDDDKNNDDAKNNDDTSKTDPIDNPTSGPEQTGGLNKNIYQHKYYKYKFKYLNLLNK